MAVARVAAIYDIHANLPALEAVLQEVRHAYVDHVVIGGDVLPGPMPRETLACLLDLDIPVQFIQIVPYVLTIVVLAGFIGHSRPPRALGRPYEKE